MVYKSNINKNQRFSTCFIWFLNDKTRYQTMTKIKDIQFCVKNLKMKRKKDKKCLTFHSEDLNPRFSLIFPPMIWIFMWSEEPEIKSKQASKRDRTLLSKYETTRVTKWPFWNHRLCTALRAHPPAQLYSTLWSELWWEKYRLSALIYGTTWMTLEWTPCTSTWFLWGANDTTLHFRSVMFIWELLLLADLLEDFQSVFLCVTTS